MPLGGVVPLVEEIVALFSSRTRHDPALWENVVVGGQSHLQERKAEIDRQCPPEMVPPSDIILLNLAAHDYSPYGPLSCS